MLDSLSFHQVKVRNITNGISLMISTNYDVIVSCLALLFRSVATVFPDVGHNLNKVEIV